MLRVFKQFYIEFEGCRDCFRELPSLVAVVINELVHVSAELTSVEFRQKMSANEYRITTNDGLEVKVGCGPDPKTWDPVKVWIHLSAPENSEINLKELAYEIINHPKFLEVNREKGGEG